MYEVQEYTETYPITCSNYTGRHSARRSHNIHITRQTFPIYNHHHPTSQSAIHHLPPPYLYKQPTPSPSSCPVHLPLFHCLPSNMNYCYSTTALHRRHTIPEIYLNQILMHVTGLYHARDDANDHVDDLDTLGMQDPFAASIKRMVRSAGWVALKGMKHDYILSFVFLVPGARKGAREKETC